MSALIIANTQIRRDVAGRYCLNDLHQASGGESRHQPAKWMALKSTHELIEEVMSDGANSPDSESYLPVEATAGRFGGGTYAVKELVYAYAMWISAAFHLHVIRAYDAQVTGQGVDNPDALDLPTGPGPAFAADRVVGAARTFTSLQRAARAMGLSAARAVASANAATLRATGIDLAAELDIDLPAEPLPAPGVDAGAQVVEVVRRFRRKGLPGCKVRAYSHAARKLPPAECDALLAPLVAEGRLVQSIPPGRRAPFLYHPDFAPEAVLT